MLLNWITMLLPLVVVIGATVQACADDVIPTNRWTDFGSNESTINGELIPVGTIIDAYDNDGVHCGQRISGPVAGRYIAMPVYGDDFESEDVDEGCVLDEHVIFKVNGKLATELGPDDDIWRGEGPIKVMDLAITQTFALAISGPAGDSGEPGETVSYQVTVDNQGDGTDLVVLDITSQHGWEVVDPPADAYIDAGAAKAFDVKVRIPSSAPPGTEDTLRVVAYSRFDASGWDDLKVVTLVGGAPGLSLTGPTSGSGGPGDTVDYSVLLSNLSQGSLTVMVSAASSGGWEIVTPPDPSYSLGPLEAAPIEIGLEIPETAEAGEVDTLTIIANSEGVRELTDTLTIITSVTINYGVAISGPTFGSGDPGVSIDYYPITIKNTGSQIDRASFDWQSSQGFSVQAPADPTEEIAPDATLDVTFTVKIPISAVPDSRDTLKIVASSVADPSKQDTLTIVTLVRISYGVSVIGPDSGYGTPGSQVEYEVTIYNEGYYYDSLEVEVNSSSSWTLGGLPDSVESYPGTDGEVFLITVDIPPDASPGDRDTLTIVATSLSDTDKSDTLKIITVVDEHTAVDGLDYKLPESFELFQNFPNPFNPETTIPFRLETPDKVTLEIYDVRGCKVRTIDAGYLPAGAHWLRWDGTASDNRQAASGVYFYRLKAGDTSQTRKMVLLR